MADRRDKKYGYYFAIDDTMHKLELEVPSLGESVKFKLDGKVIYTGEE